MITLTKLAGFTYPRNQHGETDGPPSIDRPCVPCNQTTRQRIVWDTGRGPAVSTRPEGILICAECRHVTQFRLAPAKDATNTKESQ